MTARTIIVGDVHGMLVELKALLSATGLSREDRVVFVGDLVDKGPDSCGVVTFARSLRDQGVDVVLVQGNHEEKHARFRKAFAAAGEAGVKKFKGVEELRAITEGLSDQDVAFLDSAVPFYRVPDRNVVVVHGGVLPTWETLDASDKGVVSRMLRVRHVRGVMERKITIEFTVDGDGTFNIPDLVKLARSAVPVREQRKNKGDFISLGEEGPDDPFWADVYDGRFGHIYFGHSPFPEAETPVLFPHATGLDLGAVFGGRLAAVVLETGKPDQAVTVEATGKFATSFWEDSE